MPRIITFTANLLAETTFHVASWREGETARSHRETFQVGGKGINVSKMLDRLGADNAAICFPGGLHGPLCLNWLEEKGIKTLAFVEGCETRSGAVIRADSREETTILGKDCLVSEMAIRAAAVELKNQEAPFVFAICGSIPEWEHPKWDALRDWISVRPENVSLAVDSYGPCLPWFLEQKPDIVKFNRTELLSLFSKDARKRSTDDLLQEATDRWNGIRWVVTDGGEPIWLQDGEEMFSIVPPEVDCISPTGCGDVFFATLLDCVHNREGWSLRKAAELASDYASRSAAMPGIAEFEV